MTTQSSPKGAEVVQRNGSAVTNRQLNDKLELLRAEQQIEHVKTRAIATGELNVLRADQRTEHVKTRLYAFGAVALGAAVVKVPDVATSGVTAFIWPF